jgi:hypothetical protein
MVKVGYFRKDSTIFTNDELFDLLLDPTMAARSVADERPAWMRQKELALAPIT